MNLLVPPQTCPARLSRGGVFRFRIDAASEHQRFQLRDLPPQPFDLGNAHVLGAGKRGLASDVPLASAYALLSSARPFPFDLDDVVPARIRDDLALLDARAQRVFRHPYSFRGFGHHGLHG
ncbi:protein of unknown function [Methylorubrum extorquens]|uniref:Uncharacterized protein n=1 Tax=Methylorubrum extorquens TaxID=408 RepID=A0A2N9ANA0_METEX|nr:protein of unknown function [Methylorubrum extorquens]